jgi:hypothetical protein
MKPQIDPLIFMKTLGCMANRQGQAPKRTSAALRGPLTETRLTGLRMFL